MKLVLIMLPAFVFCFYYFTSHTNANQENPVKINREKLSSAIYKGGKIKVAVLPFVDLHPGKDTENFGIAFADAATMELANISRLSVISPASTAKYIQKIPEPEEIKNEFDADCILISTFVKEDDKFEIISKLVEVKSGHIIFTTRLNSANQQLSALQKEIAVELFTKFNLNTTATAFTTLTRMNEKS